jgi:nicotinate-nucleotide adenylyltransferase
MKKMRIGLFGGTFNPIHLGHLRAAEIVQKRFLLDKVLFIPSYTPPHKNSVEIAPPFARLEMVKIACSSYPQFLPSSVEIEAKGKSYSILTVNKIEKMFPEAWIFFILGVDSFLEIETWREYEELLQLCFFIVVSRPGYRLEEAKEITGKYRERMYEIPESGESSEIRESLLSSFQIFLLPISALDIASTEIRNRAKKGSSLKRMVPDAVEAYIKENRLYKEQN